VKTKKDTIKVQNNTTTLRPRATRSQRSLKKMATKNTRNSVGTLIKPTSTNMIKRMEKVLKTRKTTRRVRARRIKKRELLKTKTRSPNHARKSSKPTPLRMMKIDTSAET
jgi:hypothetical protein